MKKPGLVWEKVKHFMYYRFSNKSWGLGVQRAWDGSILRYDVPFSGQTMVPHPWLWVLSASWGLQCPHQSTEIKQNQINKKNVDRVELSCLHASDICSVTFYHKMTVLNDLRKKTFKNIVGKGENDGYHHFLLFPWMFSTLLSKNRHHLSHTEIFVCKCFVFG